MSNYIKEYKVLGTTYGIEDFRSLGEHFFNGKDSSGKPHPHFMLWARGCRVGTAKTLDDANTKLYHYIVKRVTNKLTAAKEIVTKCKQAEYRLLMSKNNLEHFKVPKTRKIK